MRGLFLLVVLTMGVGCAQVPGKPSQGLGPMAVKVSRTGYSIQLGAFRALQNAVRLTRSLENRGIDAYYFRTKQGLFKVRFGDFSSWVEARRNARSLVRAGVIDDYYLVPPKVYGVGGKKEKSDADGLRKEIVVTAERFIGLPYRWGGSSVKDGFDCSGLVMAVYHLNGITLPRTSKEQYRVGKPLPRTILAEGDLVFFDTTGANRVSHVGIYMGDGRFIHAPGRGKHIRLDSLSNSYYATRYKGARGCL